MEIVLAGRYLLNTSRIGSGAFGQIYQGKKYYISLSNREMLENRRQRCHQNGKKRNNHKLCRKKTIHKQVCTTNTWFLIIYKVEVRRK
jgi:hypothetical protein